MNSAPRTGPKVTTSLDRGGTLAIAGIHLTDIPAVKYSDELFYEKQICSVTTNTGADGSELLALAADMPLIPTTTAYDFPAADRALDDLANPRITGAAVLKIL
ncbi:hypothetical protein [Paenarthrobacter sp.]|uniref:hypothetical protein n=1 Tax=Paenarthrobacter sp. TaxID=1931993 RepID=UPI002810BD91|nr:hypothetical protein [Paenarthrobacter sp.]